MSQKRMNRARLPIAALLVAACGSRTGLSALVEGAQDGSPPDDVADTGAPDASDIPDAQEDVVGPDGARPSRCTSDAQCDDGVDCTVDRCNLATSRCTHEADNTLCSPGYACQPPCVPTSFAEDAKFLYGVDLRTGTVKKIGPTHVLLEDIALHPDGTLCGVSFDNYIYTIDPKTGATTIALYLHTGGVLLYALGYAPDGTLYGAGDGMNGVSVFRIAKSGEATLVATEDHSTKLVRPGIDLAIIGQQIIVTIENDLLFFDLATFKPTRGVRTRGGNLQGLAAQGAELFGFSSDGTVSRIDPATGHTTRLSSFAIEFLGAASR
jgi:DNA-binding beta-propeller fold protein YncE